MVDVAPEKSRQNQVLNIEIRDPAGTLKYSPG
jgi:hypothetical protein